VESVGDHGIAVTHDGLDVAVLTLTGEQDHYSSRALSATLAAELEAGRNIVVDLTRTAFIDSTSAGALLVSDQRATAAARRLVILLTDETPEPVARLFETARLTTILTVVASAEAALELARTPL
jgi:anti-anti-sigma factor